MEKIFQRPSHVNVAAIPNPFHVFWNEETFHQPFPWIIAPSPNRNSAIKCSVKCYLRTLFSFIIDAPCRGNDGNPKKSRAMMWMSWCFCRIKFHPLKTKFHISRSSFSSPQKYPREFLHKLYAADRDCKRLSNAIFQSIFQISDFFIFVCLNSIHQSLSRFGCWRTILNQHYHHRYSFCYMGGTLEHGNKCWI